jgi:hypothetical protein
VGTISALFRRHESLPYDEKAIRHSGNFDVENERRLHGDCRALLMLMVKMN